MLAQLLNLPWLELVGRLWRAGQKILRGLASEGVYEVLEYECGVELKDREGKQALIRKRERVRYLQDYIMTYQDQAWGDGKILLNYRCSPGVPVDHYQLGHKTYRLISLRGSRNKGDVDQFDIEWKMKNGFLKSSGYWGTSINHRTKRAKVEVVFPKDRPPHNATIFESNVQRGRPLAAEEQRRLPDGRTVLVWEQVNPRVYEDYIVRWEW